MTPELDLPPWLDAITPEWVESIVKGLKQVGEGLVALPQKPGLDQALDQAAWSLEGKAIAWTIEKITNLTSSVAGMLLQTPPSFLESEAFRAVYGQVVVMADVILLPLVAGYGLATVAGWRGDTEGVVRRLATAALVINVAPFGVQWLVEAGNALAVYVASGATIVAPIINDPRGAETGLLLFLVIYVYLIMKIALQSARRTFGLVAWTAMAPIIWTLSFLPGQEHRGRQWMSKVFGLVAEQVAVAIQLALMVRLTMTPAVADVPPAQVFMFQAGALLFMAETPSIIQEWASTGAEPRNLGRAALDLLTLRRLRQQVGQSKAPSLVGGFLGKLGVLKGGKLKWN